MARNNPAFLSLPATDRKEAAAAMVETYRPDLHAAMDTFLDLLVEASYYADAEGPPAHLQAKALAAMRELPVEQFVSDCKAFVEFEEEDFLPNLAAMASA